MFIFDISKWVPKFILWDKNGYALAKAIEAGLQKMNDIIRQGVDCITDYDTMPEWRLDELAWETNFLYDYSADVEIKRRLLKNVFYIYRRLGTKAAVENALQAIFPGSDLQEWFEYGGEPFYFRMEIELPDSGITPEQQARALRSILFYKNARSVLEGINYTREVTGDTKIGACTAAMDYIEVWPQVVERLDATGDIITTGAVAMQPRLEVFPAADIQQEPANKKSSPK